MNSQTAEEGGGLKTLVCINPKCTHKGVPNVVNPDQHKYCCSCGSILQWQCPHCKSPHDRKMFEAGICEEALRDARKAFKKYLEQSTEYSNPVSTVLTLVVVFLILSLFLHHTIFEMPYGGLVLYALLMMAMGCGHWATWAFYKKKSKLFRRFGKEYSNHAGILRKWESVMGGDQ